MLNHRKTITVEGATMKIEALCSRAEYSRLEVVKKLISWGLSRSQADDIADDLVDRRFVDDERFARGFTRDKLEYSKWGRRKISLSLIQKGIDRHFISQTLDEIDPERYLSIIVDLVRQKARQTPDADTYEGRQKILRFMISRGFEPSLVIPVIKNRALWAPED